MTEAPKLGPVSQCSLIASDGEAAVAAYTRWLHLHIVTAQELDADTAMAIGYADLAGERSWLLANSAGRQWLQIVEHSAALPRDSLHSFGWMALEVLVEDVDKLAASLAESPFEILRPPADLDLSDKIRACQVRGPCGEVLYLTQISAAVPPFDLPSCEASVDRLFIPVLSTPSRELSLAQYSSISGNTGISFETKVTVVNQARGYELGRLHQVATLQLAGQALLELDQIDNTVQLSPGTYQGMACVALDYCEGEGNITPQLGPFTGRNVSPHVGHAGERFALLHP